MDTAPEQGEFRVIGPPGCGKTTYLRQQVNLALEEGKKVCVSSLTHTTAEEIAAASADLYPWEIGTLHSHAYHALDRPELVHSASRIKEWNALHPHWTLSDGKGVDVDSDNLEPGYENAGDRLMNHWQIARAKGIPEEKLHPAVRKFGQEWQNWKRESGLLDFTDLIAKCLEEVSEAPGEPDAIFVDEAQDLDWQEAALLKKWGQAAGSLTFVGDPDQNLYGWRGSDARAFLEPPLPEERWQTLSQSYRLPRQVHAAAVQWIQQTPGRSRDAQFNPTAMEGEMRVCPANWLDPGPIVEDASRHLDLERTVMFIASCNYMLQPLVDLLKKQGLPFHNPLRPSNGAWNPIQKRKGSKSSAERLTAFLRMSAEGYWTAGELRDWTEAVKAEALTTEQGFRKKVADIENDETTEGYPPCLSYGLLERLLKPEAIEAGMTGDTGWYLKNLMKNRRKAAEFPVAVVNARGPDALLAEPQIIIGTIHSVKGGEADCVYLFPGLSHAGSREWQGTARQKAGVYRLFYVGMTRARHSLNICQPARETYPRNLPGFQT